MAVSILTNSSSFLPKLDISSILSQFAGLQERIQSIASGVIACSETGLCELLCSKTAVDPYLSGRKNGPSLLETPHYVHQIMHPGIYYTSNGQGGLLIQNNTLLSEKRLRRAFATFLAFAKTQPDMQAQMKKMCPEEPDMKGCVAFVGEDKILIGVPKEKMQSHMRGVAFIRAWVGRIDRLSEEEIVSNILQSHGLLCRTVSSPGIYRQDSMCVFRDNEEDQDRSPKALSRLIAKRGGSKEDVKAFHQYLNKGQKGKADLPLTPAERKALSYICHPTPYFKEIPDLMLQFAKDLKAAYLEMKRCNHIDPIALASFVHQKLGEIHPFADGNGRLARAMMNGILMEHGIDPAVFFNDPEYVNAVEKDQTEPGYFSKFLTETIFPRLEKARKLLNQ